jgi:enamine deaminase RidA (YjgF/YER057c/UK114 family)
MAAPLSNTAAAIKSEDLLFVSGQVGSLEDGSPEPNFENR